MEIKNGVKGLKEESKVYEREILSLLLEISKSFSSGDMTKEKRNENFKKIDEFREKIKDISKIIEDIENSKYDCVYKDENINERLKKVTENTSDNEYTLDNIECISKQEVTSGNEDKDSIDFDVVSDKEYMEEHSTELTEEDLNNIDKVIENIGKENNTKKEISNKVVEDKEDEELKIENYDVVSKKEEINSNELNQDLGEEAIEKIDRLIKEAKELNNAVIKFPEDKVIRRSRSRQYEEIEEMDSYIKNGDLSFDYNPEKYSNLNDEIEPVPVLFGERRAQNQMIVRKKSNSFSDKLKTLIFKIKIMLGGEDEE